MNDFVTGLPSRGIEVPDKMLGSITKFVYDWHTVITSELDRKVSDGTFVSTTGTPESKLVCSYLNSLLSGVDDL